MFLFPEPNLLMSPGNFDGVLKHREQNCNQCMATKNLQDHNCHVTTCFNCKMHAIMTDTIKYQSYKNFQSEFAKINLLNFSDCLTFDNKLCKEISITSNFEYW